MPITSERLPDLGALALFIAVDETGSVGAAARRFGISQPAASQRLRALERQLDLVLLDRRTTGSQLTNAGRVVAGWAEPLVRSGASFTRGVAALAGSGRSRLRVAASLTVADYLMPGWLLALQEALPDVAVSLEPANSRRVAELVLDDRAEIGFIEGPRAPQGLKSRVIGHDRLAVVVAPNHPWARKRHPVTAREVAGASLVLREPDSGTRQVLDDALRRHELEARPALELGSTTSIKEAVGSGKDAAVLSLLSVRSDLAAGVLVEVETLDLDLSRVFRAVWRRSHPPSGAAGALLVLSARSLRVQG